MTDNPNKKSLWDKIHLDPTMLLILLALLTYSALVIWSASGQDMGMMERKIGQIAMGIVIMIVMAQIPPRVYEGWAPYLYIFCIILLVAVDAFGAISKGAQRWLDLGIVRFQPSEIAKIAVPLMVARFINRDVCPPSLKNTAIALVLIFLPTLLVAAQPDLGTSILVALSGLFVLFLSGLSWRLIGIAVVLVAAFIPILWFFLMHDYQRQRVMMLLDPETDPLGAGYHIIQSKIAIGSGGLRGKGWLHGTQSQLEFLPERHTDFIFAVLAEELGRHVKNQRQQPGGERHHQVVEKNACGDRRGAGKHALKIVDFQMHAHAEHNQHQQRRDPRANGGKSGWRVIGDNREQQRP